MLLPSAVPGMQGDTVTRRRADRHCMAVKGRWAGLQAEMTKSSFDHIARLQEISNALSISQNI